MAYVLGFIYADGNIVHTKRNTWFLSIQITDKAILEQIKLAMGSFHKISNKKRKRGHKQLYRLQIGSKAICEDLISLGLTERKSKTILFPDIPYKYLPDFLRGYFDGDGGVWVGLKNKKTRCSHHILSTYFTSGSRIFLEELRVVLRKMGIQGGSLVKKERGFDLKYSVKDSLNLYKIMYNGRGQMFLKRKKEKFENYIKMRS